MKKIIEGFKYVKFSDLLAPIIFLIAFVPSIVFRLINKINNRKLWLICEDGKSARDNGYHFFKYVREKHPNDFCFYVIDKKSSDFNKVKDFGNIVNFKSFFHWVLYLSADFNISNHKNGNPNQIFFYILHVSFGLYKNRVFLQHGITKDDAEWLYYKNTKFRYFVCGAKREFDFIGEKFGYPEKNLIYTGFPRFDNLHDLNVNSKQILIMPTWRNWLGREKNSLSGNIIFKDTDFFINWNKLLCEKKFIEFIEKNDLKILFYPHINMQKYLKEFEVLSKNIELVDPKTDIQKVLKESVILITDYSSVYMDFAYMNKETIYYQFDFDEYRSKQYKAGYFDYNKDSFGPIIKTPEELVGVLEKLYSENFKVEDIYLKRIKSFFELHDNKNCERIYNILINKGEV